MPLRLNSCARSLLSLKIRKVTQTAAARRLGVEQPGVSELLRGHFRQCSGERLMRFLVALDHDIEMVRPVSAVMAKAKAAQLTVT